MSSDLHARANIEPTTHQHLEMVLQLTIPFGGLYKAEARTRTGNMVSQNEFSTLIASFSFAVNKERQRNAMRNEPVAAFSLILVQLGLFIHHDMPLPIDNLKLHSDKRLSQPR